MTVREMNIDVRSQLQRLSANRTRKLEDDHVDWYLNVAQQEMIESSLEAVAGSGRYRIKADRHGIVAGLTVNRYSLSATWMGIKYMSTLPANFWYLIDDGSQVSQLCKGDTKTIGYEVLNITRVPFPLSLLSTNCYTDLQVIYNNNIVFNIADLMQQRQVSPWNGLKEKDGHFYVKELLIQQLGKIGIGVYWQQYHSFNYPYHLIFVSTGSPVSITLQVDGTQYNGVNEQLTTEIHSGSRTPVTSPNSMVSSDKEIAVGATPFFKTSYISPVSEKGAGVVYTHGNDSFIVYKTVINYIRKPAVISLSLGTDCELSADIHQALCNKTAEIIMNRIDNPNWKELIEQNQLNNR